MTYGNYLFTIEEVRRAIRFPSHVTREKLHEWVQVANTMGDFWLKAQLAQIIGELHPGEPEWGEIVKAWLIQAVERHSWWTDELLVLVLRGWPDLLLQSPMMLKLIDQHPAGVASGLLEAVKRRAIEAHRIPDEWLSRLKERLTEIAEPHRQVVGSLLTLRKKEAGDAVRPSLPA